jgi:hypothetical protein
MWSTRIIRTPLYVVDIRNGLYPPLPRPVGQGGVSERRFLEGNSNPGAYAPPLVFSKHDDLRRRRRTFARFGDSRSRQP